MVKYAADGIIRKEKLEMAKSDTPLILTGWGYPEYVASAASAMKAFGGKADVFGVSRRRLPEFLAELAADKAVPRWTRIYLLGLSLAGDPETLAAALSKLRQRGVEITWISALEMPSQIKDLLGGAMKVRYRDGTLLEAVGETFGVDVAPYMPFLKDQKRAPAAIRPYFTLIATAQFYYRNYQDESLYSTCVRYLASGVSPEAWEPGVRIAVAHYDRYGNRELLGKSDAITTLQERINRVAKHEHARVLILGESGTGKETVAQQIHTKSPRRDMPFIAFNCGSVMKDLLEDRFFGHERGAFTNAVERKIGRAHV